MKMINSPSQDQTNLLNLPNKYLRFDEPWLISCGLDNAEELLIHSQQYLSDWCSSRLSVHQFAEKFSSELSLWTANEEAIESGNPQTFAFYIEFTQPYGYILVQCPFERQERLQ